MFSKFKKPYSIWVLVGGFNFWLGAYNVPEGFSANPYGEAWSAEFMKFWSKDRSWDPTTDPWIEIFYPTTDTGIQQQILQYVLILIQ